MSQSVHYRLPDQLVLDVKEYAKSQGVSVTDIIIQGLQAILQPVKATQFMSLIRLNLLKSQRCQSASKCLRSSLICCQVSNDLLRSSIILNAPAESVAQVDS